mmetsp:Transcript_32461/g.72886  ORF Transcript_32461/g.72886 Transcript_32461/m.72886 type:complete len:221 (+) Transcript_32461:2938-3600(+)
MFERIHGEQDGACVCVNISHVCVRVLVPMPQSVDHTWLMQVRQVDQVVWRGLVRSVNQMAHLPRIRRVFVTVVVAFVFVVIVRLLLLIASQCQSICEVKLLPRIGQDYVARFHEMLKCGVGQLMLGSVLATALQSEQCEVATTVRFGVETWRPAPNFVVFRGTPRLLVVGRPLGGRRLKASILETHPNVCFVLIVMIHLPVLENRTFPSSTAVSSLYDWL